MVAEQDRVCQVEILKLGSRRIGEQNSWELAVLWISAGWALMSHRPGCLTNVSEFDLK